MHVVSYIPIFFFDLTPIPHSVKLYGHKLQTLKFGGIVIYSFFAFLPCLDKTQALEQLMNPNFVVVEINLGLAYTMEHGQIGAPAYIALTAVLDSSICISYTSIKGFDGCNYNIR